MIFFVVCGVAVVLLVIILIFLHKYEKKRKLANTNSQLEEFLANVEKDDLTTAPLEESSKDVVEESVEPVEAINEVVQETKPTEVVETTEVMEEATQDSQVEAPSSEEQEKVGDQATESVAATTLEEVDGASVINTKSTKFVVSILYSKSFNAQVVLQPNLKPIYKEINEEFLSYKNVKARLSFKGVRYSIGRQLLAKMFVRGKRIYLYYALDPQNLEEKYHLKDVSDKKIGAELPALQRVLSPRSVFIR